MSTEDLYEQLDRLGDESRVAHHPMCAAHPALDDGTCCCVSGQLAAVIRALLAEHHPQPGPTRVDLCDRPLGHSMPSWRACTLTVTPCPDCVVTTPTVCTCGGGHPCSTVRVVAAALGVEQ